MRSQTLQNFGPLDINFVPYRFGRMGRGIIIVNDGITKVLKP